MNEQQLVTAQNVQAYLIQRTDDQAKIGLVLKVEAGLEGFAFSPEDFVQFVGRALQMVAHKQLQIPEPVAGGQTIALPIEAISFSSEAEQPTVATVTTQLGAIQLNLSLDSDMLLRSFKDFLDRRHALRNKRVAAR